MATHCRIPAWELPWTEEPGGLQSVGRKELDTKERLNNKSKSSGNTHITCFEARGHFCYQVENCYNLKDGFSLGGRVCILSTIPVPHVDRRTKKSCPARTPAQACGGLHTLLVLSPFSRVRLCGTMDCSLPGSSGHGISQARVLEWGAISFSRGKVR